MLPDYAELHCLSNFSFLRGASHPEELVEQAVAQGYAALALTDECSLAGIVRAHQAARQAGLKLLVGSEMTTLDGLKLVFLAQNREGYGNLSALITLARRRADKGHYTCIAMTSMPSRPTARFPTAWCSGCRARGRGLTIGRWLAERFPGRLWIAVELHAGPDDTARPGRAAGAGQRLPAAAGGSRGCAYARQGAPPGTGRADRGAPEDHGFRGRLCALSQWRAPFAQPSAPLPPLSARLAGGNPGYRPALQLLARRAAL